MEHHRRFVIMCAVDSRPASMSKNDGFKLFTGGLLPQYVENAIHPSTFNKILDELCREVHEEVTRQISHHHDSVRKMGWTGPFVCVQMDLTSTHNTEYATMSISFVPEDMGGLVRLSVATKPFPGRHTQVEVEEFVRKVRTCSNYFMC